MIDLREGLAEWLKGMLIGVDYPSVDEIDTDYLAGELMECFGFTPEDHWGPISVADYHPDGSPVMNEYMFPPIHKHHFEWVTRRRWVTEPVEIGERETSEQFSARLEQMNK
jgi:hypothetical protein